HLSSFSSSFLFFFSSRRRHTRSKRDWSSDVCSSDLAFALTHSSYALTGWILSQMFFPKGLPARGEGYVTWNDQESLRIDSDHPRSEERRVGKGGRSEG